jgi:hypothetical protein
MHLLQFLEVCIGEFTLWPTYIIELLFLKEFSPENILKVAAFFYGHGVPLGIASRVYKICNNHSNHIVPYVMGGYYSTLFTNIDSIHQAQYYNVKDERILWINGYNHSQFETVDPCESALFSIDCRTLDQSQALKKETLQFTMQ